MKRFEITYWAEKNDEATDLSILIDANTEQEAIHKFKMMNILHKRIESIIEKL